MKRWFRVLLSAGLPHLSLLLTLAALGGLALLGHEYDWTVPPFAKLWGGSDKEPEKGEQTEGEVQSLPIDEPQGTDSAPASPAFYRLAASPILGASTAGLLGSPLGPGPMLAASAAFPNRTYLELASPTAALRAGVRLARVQQRDLNQFITAYGALLYDQTRYTQLSTRAPGNVWRIEKRLGASVKPGDVLALVEAPEVGKAKADFLQSVVQVNLRNLIVQRNRAASAVVPERTLQDAVASLREARIKLVADQQALANLGLPVRLEDVQNLPDQELAREIRLLGLPTEVLRDTDPNTLTANLLPLRAPLEGLVVSQHVGTGELATPAKPQFVVSDVRHLWAMLDVRREDAALLTLKQKLFFLPDGAHEDRAVLNALAASTTESSAGADEGQGEFAVGRIAWISPEVDEKTRTVRVRAEVDNPQGRFRPNTFGNGRVLVQKRPGVLVVPAEAIQTEGPYTMVFVYKTNQVFEPRLVELGLREDKVVEIVSGVQKDELVVIAGSHVLKSELFSDRISGAD